MLLFLLRVWRRLRSEVVFGFLIASVFWAGILGWQAAYAPTDAQKQECYNTAKKEGRNSEECKTLWEKATTDPVAFFTLWLVIFTGGLTVSTILLWRAGEKQFRHARRSAALNSRDMQASIKAAAASVRAAEASNILAREVFITEQRPWLRWEIPPVAELRINGRHLGITIVGSLTNLGKAPAFEISYFGKLYAPEPRQPAINIGMAYYAEHLKESMESMALASALPTETVPMKFGPYGIDISTLSEGKRFRLCLAFHAKYEFVVGERRLAEIGTVYLVQPIGKDRTDFDLADFSKPIPVVLLEWSGARRMT